MLQPNQKVWEKLCKIVSDHHLLKQEEFPEYIYHYTNTGAALKIIESKEWLLNSIFNIPTDKSEFYDFYAEAMRVIWGEVKEQKTRTALKFALNANLSIQNWRDHIIHPTCFIACFSQQKVLGGRMVRAFTPYDHQKKAILKIPTKLLIQIDFPFKDLLRFGLNVMRYKDDEKSNKQDEVTIKEIIKYYERLQTEEEKQSCIYYTSVLVAWYGIWVTRSKFRYEQEYRLAAYPTQWGHSDQFKDEIYLRIPDDLLKEITLYVHTKSDIDEAVEQINPHIKEVERCIFDDGEDVDT